jgi:hypothetical protein
MKATIGRSLRAVAGITLALLVVAGAASAALADGGPDRVLPPGSVTEPRPGFEVSIHSAYTGGDVGAMYMEYQNGRMNTGAPARPGFGDRIQPAHPAGRAPAAPVAVTDGQTTGSGASVAWIWVLVGVTVIAAAGAWAATTRRRRPLRPASGT